MLHHQLVYWSQTSNLSVFVITCKVNKPLGSIFITIDDAFSVISLQLFPLIEFALFSLPPPPSPRRSARRLAVSLVAVAPPAASCPFEWRRLVFLCLPVGNTLCKSGSIAVFGNVVYSGLLNDHLWHLGVPLFTRLVRAAGPCVHTYLHFVRRVSCRFVEPKQASRGRQNSPTALMGCFWCLLCWHVLVEVRLQDVTVLCCGCKTRAALL